MKVLKFGGTSVGTPERMHHVAELLTRDPENKIVVLSAVSGTTNSLIQIGQLLSHKNKSEAKKIIDDLKQKYISFIEALLTDPAYRDQARNYISNVFELLFSLTDKEYSPELEKELLVQGELISTNLFNLLLQESAISSTLISAMDFMSINENEEPDIQSIKEKLNPILEDNKNHQILLTQGYICLNHHGGMDNLKRGGSDYTASLIGAAVNAEEIQIWTDIDGMHNNDPRIIKNTFPIAILSFEEAAELAYFGAKILHPSTIRPAQQEQVPVRLLNTMKPEANGTLISNQAKESGLKAIAAKDNITAIKIRSSRMLLAHGFLRKVFEIFEKYKTPIDMITTSEVAVSLTIDNDKHLDMIFDELSQFGTVIVDKNQSIVCLVGDMIVDKKGIVKKIFNAMEDIPIRMISYGGSNYNISMLIGADHKACCNVSVVSIPKITGLSYFKATSFNPWATALHINSKCLVSPWMIQPKQMTASISGF